MNKKFPTAWLLVISFLVAYLLIGTLLTGKVAPFIGVLLLVLVLWFLVYKFRYKELENRELLTRMYTELKGTLQGMLEKERMAQEEARRRAAAKHERLARTKRERRARPPIEDLDVSKYADMIEDRVREGKESGGSPFHSRPS